MVNPRLENTTAKDMVELSTLKGQQKVTLPAAVLWINFSVWTQAKAIRWSFKHGTTCELARTGVYQTLMHGRSCKELGCTVWLLP